MSLRDELAEVLSGALSGSFGDFGGNYSTTEEADHV